MFFYKESTLFFDCFYWLHQCLNTTSYVGILLLPCGAPEDKGDGLCGAPLLYPLDSNSSPRGIRCGGAYWLPRVWDHIGSLYPVLSLLPNSEYGLVICVRLCIVRVSVGVLGLYRSFFIIGGRGCSYLRLRGVFAMVFRRICADRDWGVCFVW